MGCLVHIIYASFWILDLYLIHLYSCDRISVWLLIPLLILSAPVQLLCAGLFAQFIDDDE